LSYKLELEICDRGYQGCKIVEGIQILILENQDQKVSNSKKQKNRKYNKQLNTRELIIGYFKSDLQIFRILLKGILGDEINALMAIPVFNFMKWMREANLYL
jgi:hypothetical protein